MQIKWNLLFILGLICQVSIGQSFEGKIVYQNSYQSKMSNLTDEQFTAMMGTKQEYFIKGGNYKSVSNGTFLQWQLYIHTENRLYNKLSNSETVLWNDGAANPDEVLTSKINKNVTRILGRNCDELILTCKTGIQKYYFNSELRVNDELFEKHKFGNWNEIMSLTKSLPLRISIDNPQFKLECIAVEIEPATLDENMFELVPGTKVGKSPY